ncbi:MAG: response regulator receiver protein [Pseudorhodoplanes sp.]|jgi:pilus assembly protein CpaE|nr:response regulator receiver protein [Pseudorhodoplanes sp.]
MRLGRTSTDDGKTHVVLLTADSDLEESVRTTFGASQQIELHVLTATITSAADKIDPQGATVILVDLDTGSDEDMAALERLMLRIGHWPPVIVVTPNFDAHAARTLLQMRVADCLVKPIPPIELVRTCARVTKPAASEQIDAQIYTFLPAVGGAGVTTLAIQSAMILLSSGQKRRASTCLVDLNFQHGACADYLDLEPRLDLSEIEPRPERLDRQLLEVMTNYHASGLAVIAAPNRPAEMRSFDPDLVTRLLDLVASNFENVVIDMPRTWFSWTDSVLLGSNRLYIVSEMTVPSLKYTRKLVGAIRERMPDGPQPQVIVNRFEERLFVPGVKKNDIEQALGQNFTAAIPNIYRLVREAIDRGVPLDEIKPGNKISRELKKLLFAQSARATPAAADARPKPLNVSAAR